jgi:hypothetical protein
LRWMGPMAVLTCAVLVVAVMRPGLYMSMAIFAVSGTFGIYQIAANTAFVARVPNERRSQAFGVANAGLIVGQGILFLLAGAAAEKFPPAEVVAVCGGLGTVAAVILALRWRGISPVVGRHKARQAHSGGRRTRVPAPRPVLAAALAAPVPVTRSPESHSPASHSSAKARQPYSPPKAPPLPMRRPAPVHARSRTGS